MGLDEVRAKLANGDPRASQIKRLKAQLYRLEAESRDEVKSLLKEVMEYAKEVDPDYGNEIMDCLQYHLGIFTTYEEDNDGGW